MDAVIDRKFPDDLDSASIFRKVISHKISDGSRGDLYALCRMKFADYPVQSHKSQFIDLGLYTTNALDESSGLINLTTIIRRPIYGAHWSAPDHVFGETIALGVSESKSYHDYNYKTEFQIWKENKEFERQNIPTGQPPLDLTPIGMNATNTKISYLDSTLPHLIRSWLQSTSASILKKNFN